MMNVTLSRPRVLPSSYIIMVKVTEVKMAEVKVIQVNVIEVKVVPVNSIRSR